ncbi:MAG: hypothetical protein ACEPOW_08445 [Bacteroidales bacterium]
MFKFGKRSKQCLQGVHKDLQLIMEETIKVSQLDFGIHEGARTIEKQLEYFHSGKSKIDPRKKENLIHAKHVLYEGRKNAEAVDIHISSKQYAWNTLHLSFVAGSIIAIAEKLYQEKKTTHKIRWGGNWDRDKIIIEDQRFDDLPHFEIHKPEST